MYPSQRVLFCTLIPKKQEFEIMGLFVTYGLILSWLPPLIFTAMNERGIDMRWGLSIIAFFSALAFVCTLPIGKYALAVAQVNRQRQEMDSNE
jgi:MFS-type transporter involved in bile tolerance (Atg22 family)